MSKFSFINGLVSEQSGSQLEDTTQQLDLLILTRLYSFSLMKLIMSKGLEKELSLGQNHMENSWIAVLLRIKIN